MFVELVGSLRCAKPHEAGYLVATALETRNRSIVRGALGCPICNAEYEISAGVTYFEPPASPEPDAGATVHADAAASFDPEYEALRCAALLNLHGAGAYVVLTGEWCALAPRLSDSTQHHLVLLNPAGKIEMMDGASIIISPSAFPLADRSMQGVALGGSDAAQLGAGPAVRVVRDGGRLVAPVAAAVPPTARLLASDERHWVAEVSHAPIASITLRRASR